MLARAAACGVLALMVLTAGQAPAHAETWKRWGGSVTTLTPDAPGEAPLRPARCAHHLRPDNNGLIGWVIEIPPDLADGVHEFRLLDGQMSAVDGLVQDPANFDVAFYTGFPACDLEADPVRFRSPGNEHGVLPAGTTHALVTLINKPHSSVDFQIRLD